MGETPGAGNEFPFEGEVRDAQDRLRRLAQRRRAAAIALGPLVKPAVYGDLNKLDSTLTKIEAKVGAEVRDEVGLGGLLGRIRTWRHEAGDRLRRALGQELAQACQRAGLGFRIVSREEPIELRIPPFAVTLDSNAGQAEFRFSRVEVARCPARTAAILATHERARKDLDREFDPAEFFDRCHRAWRAARAGRGDPGERVEILDFLSYLALEMQGPDFHFDPIRENFKDYGRARFAWDVLRLKQQKVLSRNGLRLNLGVATGTTASQKKRVLYFEDEEGNGEYKLTIFFTSEAEGHS